MTLAKLCSAQLLVSTVAGHAWSVWSKERQARECIRDVAPVTAPETINGRCNATWWEQSLRVAAKEQDLHTVKRLVKTDTWWACIGGKEDYKKLGMQTSSWMDGYIRGRAGAEDEKTGYSALWYAATGPKNPKRGRIMKMILVRLFGDSDPESVEKVLSTLKQCDIYRNEVNNVLRQMVKSEQRWKQMHEEVWYEMSFIFMCGVDKFRHAAIRWLESHAAWPKLENLLVKTANLLYNLGKRKTIYHEIKVIAEEAYTTVDELWIPIKGAMGLWEFVKRRVGTLKREHSIIDLKNSLKGGPLHSYHMKMLPYEIRKEVLLLYTFTVQRHNAALDQYPDLIETKAEAKGRYAQCPELFGQSPRCNHKLINPFLKYVDL